MVKTSEKVATRTIIYELEGQPNCLFPLPNP